ncbi:hypothetical protein BCD_0353 [Borrelia crocidurae DOU]|uniref:Uncharacterized protein n=1 Tax=Borrelia crocidurae DOU TaxID=1293575 RepID=W5SH17_9SPIR|nr:hypothetical protein BCD_0353 [Borrelia crocidurae DOU]
MSVKTVIAVSFEQLKIKAKIVIKINFFIHIKNMFITFTFILQ